MVVPSLLAFRMILNKPFGIRFQIVVALLGSLNSFAKPCDTDCPGSPLKRAIQACSSEHFNKKWRQEHCCDPKRCLVLKSIIESPNLGVKSQTCEFNMLNNEIATKEEMFKNTPDGSDEGQLLLKELRMLKAAASDVYLKLEGQGKAPSCAPYDYLGKGAAAVAPLVATSRELTGGDVSAGIIDNDSERSLLVNMLNNTEFCTASRKNLEKKIERTVATTRNPILAFLENEVRTARAGKNDIFGRPIRTKIGKKIPGISSGQCMMRVAKSLRDVCGLPDEMPDEARELAKWIEKQTDASIRAIFSKSGLSSGSSSLSSSDSSAGGDSSGGALYKCESAITWWDPNKTSSGKKRKGSKSKSAVRGFAPNTESCNSSDSFNLNDVPEGTLAIFDGGPHGHVEVSGPSKGADTFWYSDYRRRGPRTGRDGDVSGQGRRLIAAYQIDVHACLSFKSRRK